MTGSRARLSLSLSLRKLERQLVFLEIRAQAAERNHQLEQAADLWRRRERVLDQRSTLLRERLGYMPTQDDTPC